MLLPPIPTTSTSDKANGCFDVFRTSPPPRRRSAVLSGRTLPDAQHPSSGGQIGADGTVQQRGRRRPDGPKIFRFHHREPTGAQRQQHHQEQPATTATTPPTPAAAAPAAAPSTSPPLPASEHSVIGSEKRRITSDGTPASAVSTAAATAATTSSTAAAAAEIPFRSAQFYSDAVNGRSSIHLPRIRLQLSR